MPRDIDLIVTGLSAIATILATYFAWRAIREGRSTVVLARETVELSKETLIIEREALANLQASTRLAEKTLQSTQHAIEAARQENSLIERDQLMRRYASAAEAVARIYHAATRVQLNVVTAGVELAVARALLRAALVGLPGELKDARDLVRQGSDPAGIEIILRKWTSALYEIEEALTALST